MNENISWVIATVMLLTALFSLVLSIWSIARQITPPTRDTNNHQDEYESDPSVPTPSINIIDVEERDKVA